MSEENRGPAGGSIKVKIFNQIYSLRSSTGGAEHVVRAARAVDERMHAVASQLAVHDVAKVAVLTALNFADELQSLKDSYERELQDLLERADALAAETGERAAEPPHAEPEPATGQQLRPSSWFEAIFDADTPERAPGDERLSSQISTRLQRLRQPARRPSITEGDGGKGE
jgi:cell division protein ZapA (FtsZ GTPase activity inhibitor)